MEIPRLPGSFSIKWGSAHRPCLAVSTMAWAHTNSRSSNPSSVAALNTAAMTAKGCILGPCRAHILSGSMRMLSIVTTISSRARGKISTSNSSSNPGSRHCSQSLHRHTRQLWDASPCSQQTQPCSAATLHRLLRGCSSRGHQWWRRRSRRAAYPAPGTWAAPNPWTRTPRGFGTPTQRRTSTWRCRSALELASSSCLRQTSRQRRLGIRLGLLTRIRASVSDLVPGTCLGSAPEQHQRAWSPWPHWTLTDQ